MENPSRKKVLWLTNIPSPYRVDFFNELGKRCALTVLFEKRASTERDDSWKQFHVQHFRAIFLKGKSTGVAEAVCPEVVTYIKRERYDFCFVTNFSDFTGIIAIAALKWHKIPYFVESDGGFAGTGRGIKERIKRHVLSGAQLYFSTAREHDEYYLKYGAKREQLVRYPFTSIWEKDILESPVSGGQKAALRARLGMKEEKIFLAVGQFIPRKGYDVLIKAMAHFGDKVGCFIVGGEITPEYQKLIEEHGLNNIHIVGFKSKRELSEYYMAADAFVHPCREDIWGLVVNEAMAKGLPVVTTDRCVAGLTLITEPQLGRIVPVNDPQALAAAMEEVLEMDGEHCSQRILEFIHSYSMENMVEKHIEVLERA